jgi:hypothetical protein
MQVGDEHCSPLPEVNVIFSCLGENGRERGSSGLEERRRLFLSAVVRLVA